jgi:two-component system response regulator WspF
MQSMAVHWRKAGTGILLTGMGRDGARGLLELRRAGFSTIAQDRGTSAVYGMPKAAAELGAAAHVLPLESIPTHLCQQAKNPPKPARI